MSSKPPTINDVFTVLQDLMQMTGEGFAQLDTRMDGLEGRMDGLDRRMDGLEGRMNRLEGRMDGLEGQMGKLEIRMRSIEQIVAEHSRRLTKVESLADNTYDEILSIHADIKEILDRLMHIEKRLPNLTEAEIRKLQADMQATIHWIAQVSKLKHIPVKFPT